MRRVAVVASTWGIMLSCQHYENQEIADSFHCPERPVDWGGIIFAYVYRDKILQRFVSLKGNPAIIMYGNSITAQGKWVELLRPDRCDE
jgi:hypothetical protein